MDHQHRSPSSPSAAFVRLMQTYAQPAQRYADLLVRRNRFLCSPDQDDIYALGMTKIWYAYFRPDAQQQYHYRDPTAEFRLIKMALRSVANDLIAQRRRERSTLAPLEPDDPLHEDSPQQREYSTGDFAEAVIIKLDTERFLTRKVASSTLGPVALYVSGQVKREDLAHYSDANLRVCETRLKQEIKAFLRG